MFGPSEGPCRPAGGLYRPAPDQRRRRHPPHLGDRPLQVDLQRRGVPARLPAAHQHRQGGHGGDPLRRPRGPSRGDHQRDSPRRPLRGRCRHPADADRRGLPCGPARRHLGRDEPDLDERRAAAAPDREVYGCAGRGDAGLSDRGTPGQCARGLLPGRRQCGLRQEVRRKASTGRPKKTPSWTAITNMPAAASS